MDPAVVPNPADGIQFKSGGGATPDVQISSMKIHKSNNGAGIRAHGGARGSATLSNVTISDPADATSWSNPLLSSSSITARRRPRPP
ncbi:hypothetical protein [Streptomyces huasconensis]|uniref:hypothetical protein n=1 Tax=Streptomyces huasconensis TaxID=1854574 RepID=UPI0036F72549